MSRSKKKTPICGIATAASEKFDKRCANRAYRRAIHTLCDDISRVEDHDADTEFPTVREMSDVWGFAKDGKVYNPPHRDQTDFMRK